MTRYLITGGCGFLGSNVARKVLERGGDDVLVFDNLSRVGSHLNLEWLRSSGPVRFVHGDIRNVNDVDRVIEREQPSVVVHLAGQVAMTTSLGNPRLDFETNVVGSINLLEAVRRWVPKAKVLYSSTNKVYGDLENLRYEETPTRYQLGDHPQGLPEECPLDFHSPYGCSKGAADQYMLDYARMFGLNTTVFRHSSMYGGRQFATYDQGWIGWFCAQVLAQKRSAEVPAFTVSGNGKQVRDVLHVDDLVELYLAASADLASARGQAFNIGGGVENSLSVLELLAHLGREIGVQPRFQPIPPRESDQRVFIADIRKAERLLAWRPKVSWKTGLSRMIQWIRTNEHGNA